MFFNQKYYLKRLNDKIIINEIDKIIINEIYKIFQ